MSYYSEHTQERREYQKRYYHEKQATSAEYKAAKREYIREYQRARRARIKINPTTVGTPEIFDLSPCQSASPLAHKV